MSKLSENQELFKKERLVMEKLLANNPNYFGTALGLDPKEFQVVQPIQYNTAYEELTCVGLWPEKNLLTATLEVKLPFGFLSGLCAPGSHEYVRFFIDWDDDGDFSDANEDLGIASVNVHDIPEVKKHHLCYAVPRSFKPFLATCKAPYIVRLRAILSWNLVPPPGVWNFIPIWGNVLDCWVQVDPVAGKILGIVSQEAVSDGKATKKKKNEESHAGSKPTPIEAERSQFLELIQKNPNYFGTSPESDIAALKPLKCDTSYEELKCIGLYPEENFLEAVLEVKRPNGFLGDLCSPGSYEHVRFFIDWNGDGDYVDMNDDAGVTSVNVHDIPEARQVRLCYGLGKRFKALRATCQKPYIVKLRAILSWQQVPTGPSFVPVWGNIRECWIQIDPTDKVPRHLVGEIDDPTANACVQSTLVTSCLTGGTPLTAIEILGSAGGAPFTHYTLRYSWGGNPPVNDAVVYPDCSRPPASPSSTTPVLGGTLGYLDVTLLPPGVTEFTVYLDVFGSGGSHILATRTFQVRTQAVEITAAATVNAFVAEDPFHPGTFTKLIKATNDVNPAVPEVSIGGAFSVTGSAYIVGCDRIMTQYALVHFDAPPATPVPNVPNATGGTPLVAPVIYGDSPDHPWQSGCFPLTTPNTIINGNLVALWKTDHCSFLGFDYTVPKVKPKPFWGSPPLNGRYVILLEARDRMELGGTYPGDFAAKQQVVVWIDNKQVVADLTAIGGIAGCGDLLLSDFVGTTAEVRGIAWDPPIEPTAPQQAPNDNFGSFNLGFQKNGGGGGGITAATPNVRVPNVWPGPLAPGADGTLANWDIVGALDGGPGPLPAGSPKLARGERCAYVITLHVQDTTHAGDSGSPHQANALYAINIINDIT